MVFLVFAENSIQLVPDGTIFLHIALILFMIWFLNRTLFKPINRILAERDKQTGGRSSEAESLVKEADAKLAEYEQTLRDARSAGYGVIERERAAALEIRNERIEAVKMEVAEMIATEKAALGNQVTSAQTQLRSDAKVLAERISSTILKQTA